LILKPVGKLLYKLSQDAKSGVKREEVDAIMSHLKRMDLGGKGMLTVYEVHAALTPLMMEGMLSKASMAIAADMLAGAVVKESNTGSKAVNKALKHVRNLRQRMVDDPLGFTMPEVLNDLAKAREVLEQKKRNKDELASSAVTLAKHTVSVLKNDMEEFMAHMNEEGAELTSPAAIIYCATQSVSELERISASAKPILEGTKKTRQGLEPFRVDLTELNRKHRIRLRSLRLCKKPAWSAAYEHSEAHLTGAYGGGVDQGKLVKGVVLGDWLKLDENLWLPIHIDGITVLVGKNHATPSTYIAKMAAPVAPAATHKQVYGRVDAMSSPLKAASARRPRSRRSHRRGLIKSF